MPKSHLLNSKFFRWSKKGSVAILDQVLFNGVHFVAAILLARWLTPIQYGVFAFTYSILLLFGAFHMAILIEPMLIFGAGKYKDNFKRYLGILVCSNFGVTLLGSFMLIVICAFMGNIRLILLALAVSLPFILLLWLLRRAFYVKLNPNWSVIGGLIYVVLLLFTIFLLHHKGNLSVTTYYLSMGFCSLVVSLFFIYLLKPNASFTSNQDLFDIRNSHFNYGKWAIWTNTFAWGVNNLYFIVLPVIIGFDGIATLRALMNLSTPIIQVNSALTFLLIPFLSKKKSEEPFKVPKASVMFIILFIFMGLIYSLGLIFFGRSAILFLYNNKYLKAISLIPFIAILSLLGAIFLILEIILRSLNNPKKVFWSYLTSIFILLTSSLLFVKTFALKGALLGYNLSYISAILLLGFFVKVEISKLVNVKRMR